MRILIRSLLVLLACVGVADLASAQNESKNTFAPYNGAAAQHLKRIHGDDARAGGLAFRSNYPGGFEPWQREARKKLIDLLGLHRIKRDVGTHKPVVRLGKPIQEDRYQRRLGNIETEPGVKIPFWLLTPDNETTSDRPLAICAHGHDSDGWNTYAGVYKNDSHRKSTLAKDGDPGVQAVKRGFVAIVPATRGLASAVSIPDIKGRHGNRPCRAQLIHCLLAGRTAVGERVWDTQRLLDWALKELPRVDRKKVVLMGNSGGGVLTVYVAALDERVTVAVPSCSFSSFTSASGFVFHCDCCLVPRAQAELGDMADIGSLTAPRALLAVHGRKDGLHSFPDVETAMARVASIYTAADASKQFQHKWGTSGHKFYPNIMWPFIEEKLGR